MADAQQYTGDVAQFMGGEYYHKDDFDEDLLLTIQDVEQVRFENKDHTTETKLQLTFTGDGTKKLTLNKTNTKILVKAYGRQAAAWIGKSVVLYLDENVQFGGNLVGGLRLRVPKARRQAPPPEAPPPESFEIDDNDNVVI